MKNGFNVTRVYITACIGMSFYGIAFIVLGSVLPMLTLKYGLTELQSSSLVTLLTLGVLLASLIFGPIVDRFGYKRLLVVSTALLGVGLLGLSSSDKLTALQVCIFAIGLGGGVLNGETNALVAEIYEGRIQASRLSFLGVCYGVGALVVPLVLSVLSKIYSYEFILRWTSFIVLLCVALFGATVFPEPKQKQGFPIKDALKLLKQPTLLVLSFILFFQSGLEGLFNNWSTTFLTNGSIQHDKALLALTALVLGMTLMRLLLSYLFRVVKIHQILCFGVALVFIGMILLNYSTSFAIATLSLFTVGAGLAGVYPIVIGRIGTIYREISGTAIGIALFVALSGNSILNYIMGRFNIEAFPVFLLICLAIQTLLMVVGRKHISDN